MYRFSQRAALPAVLVALACFPGEAPASEPPTPISALAGVATHMDPMALLAAQDLPLVSIHTYSDGTIAVEGPANYGDCVPGYLCVWQDPGYAGRLWQFRSRGEAWQRLAGFQDVAAETFTVAWRRLDVVPDEALPWLYQVARRTLANQRRSAQRQVAVAEEVFLSERDMLHHGGADPGEQAARRDVVLRALRSLSDADREIIRLAAWEELDPAEIAVVLECAKATVPVRLHRARKRLAKALAAAGHISSETSPPEARQENANAGR